MAPVTQGIKSEHREAEKPLLQKKLYTTIYLKLKMHFKEFEVITMQSLNSVLIVFWSIASVALSIEVVA